MMRKNKRIVILFLPNIYPHVTGGLEIFYYWLLKEVSLEYDLYLASRKRISHSGMRFIPISGRLFLKLGGERLGQLSLFITFAFQLFVRGIRPDLVHIPVTRASGFYGYLFPSLSRIMGFEYILVCHSGGMGDWSPSDPNWKLYASARDVYGVSSDVVKDLKNKLNKEIGLLLPMVPYSNSKLTKDNLRNKYNLPEQSKVFLMVGSLKPLKGSFYVLKELGRLGIDRLKYLDAYFLFAGDGIDRFEMETYIINNNLAERVRLLGNVQNEKVGELYELSDFYVMASDFEGTSKAMLEAMQKRVPIIATDVDGINNILRHNVSALLFDRTENSLREVLERVLQGKESYKSLAEKAYGIYNSQYHFQLTVDAVKKVYG